MIMPRPSYARILAAEFLGTMFLLATVIGSGIMAERLADGNLAVALLGNTIPTGAILYVLITIFGPVSGAHFNPAVTIAFLLRRDIPFTRAVHFMFVQVAGAICGAFLAHFMFDMPILQLSENLRSGPSQWGSEFVATFGLLMVVFGGLRWRPDTVPMLVGLYITAAYWFTSSTSFANPAVTFARSLTDSFSGILPAHATGFILAQLAAAVVAPVVLGWLFAETNDDTDR